MVLVTHHIDGKDIPFPDRPSNLADICPDHHALVHNGSVVIEKWVLTTEGRKLMWHNKGEQGLTGEDAVPYQIGSKS